jgi:hypothetical protein
MTPPTRAEVQRLLDIENLLAAGNSNEKLDPVAEAVRKRKEREANPPQHQQQSADEHPKGGPGATQMPDQREGEDEGDKKTKAEQAGESGGKSEAGPPERKRVRFEEIARNGQLNGAMMPKGTNRRHVRRDRNARIAHHFRTAAAATAYNARTGAEERSQIERPTPAEGDTCGFIVSGDGFRRNKYTLPIYSNVRMLTRILAVRSAGSSQSVEQQHVTLMSVEVHGKPSALPAFHSYHYLMVGRTVNSQHAGGTPAQPGFGLDHHHFLLHPR